MINKKDCIQNYLDRLLPNATCELNYTKDYELVIAVMLSAQTQDVYVNKVTEILFKKFDSLEKLANASEEEIVNIIHSIGLSKIKAKNIKEICLSVLEKYDGKIPSDKNELQTLPGIGNKSAGVIRAEIFKIPDFPVDTHILRVSKRLNLANEKDQPIDVELKLKKYFDENCWIKLHHQLIHFGRYYCKSRSPLCKNCQIRDFCSYDKNDSV